MLLIGFGSRARQGKDTAGESVVNHLNGSYDLWMKHDSRLRHSKYTNTYPKLNPKPQAGLFKFAAALYQECREKYGMTEKDAPLLQRIGSERRAENPNYWVDKVFESVPTNLGVAVITDLRYQNEAWAIKERGGFTVRIVRLNADGTPYIAGDRPADHPSETDLDGYNFDFRIVAKSGETAWVEQQAITLVEYLLGLTKS